MPTYVYRCTKCEEHLEVFQSFSEAPLRRHDGGCGGKLVKVLSPVGIVLKGSGFYKNDSRSGSSKTASKRREGSEAAGDAKGKADAPKAPSEAGAPAPAKSDGKSDGTAKKTA